MYCPLKSKVSICDLHDQHGSRSIYSLATASFSKTRSTRSFEVCSHATACSNELLSSKNVQANGSPCAGAVDPVSSRSSFDPCSSLLQGSKCGEGDEQKGLEGNSGFPFIAYRAPSYIQSRHVFARWEFQQDTLAMKSHP